jgi:hypothetical protein
MLNFFRKNYLSYEYKIWIQSIWQQKIVPIAVDIDKIN